MQETDSANIEWVVTKDSKRYEFVNSASVVHDTLFFLATPPSASYIVGDPPRQQYSIPLSDVAEVHVSELNLWLTSGAVALVVVTVLVLTGLANMFQGPLLR